jgi:hypothetical protein
LTNLSVRLSDMPNTPPNSTQACLGTIDTHRRGRDRQNRRGRKKAIASFIAIVFGISMKRDASLTHTHTKRKEKGEKERGERERERES